MSLIKDNSTFRETFNGVIEGETNLVTGYNAIYQKLLDNTNYLNENKADALGAVSLTASSFATNGYRKTSDGLIIQWGYYTYSSSSIATITFPISFPNACLNIQVTSNQISNWNYDNDTVGVRVNNTASFTVINDYIVSGIGRYWFAIGY